MPFCSAFGCSNSCVKGSGISFFGFPKDEAIRRIWIQRIRRKNFVPTTYSKLCSEHFEKTAYERDPEEFARLGYSGARAKLKPDAVPTLFSVDAEAKQQKWSAEPLEMRPAYAKRQRKEVVAKMTSDHTAIMHTQTETESHGECSVGDDTPQGDPMIIPTMPVEESSVRQRHVKCQATFVPAQRTRRIQVTPSVRNYAVQVNQACDQPDPCKMVSTSTQCTLIGGDLADIIRDSVCSDTYEVGPEKEDPADPDFEPESDSDSETDDEDQDEYSMPLHADCGPSQERQFLVSESNLVKLLMKCTECGSDARIALKRICGTMIVVQCMCLNGHNITWCSQSLNKKMPWGNMLFCGAILFSGSSPSNVICLFNHLKVPTVSLATYIRVQNAYLCPAVSCVWTEKQTEYLQAKSTKLLTLGGDGRCDSPGHSAKYGTYSLMDLETKYILDVQLVQVSEVKGSVHMELEGLQRGLDFLLSSGCLIGDLVTDRHVMVKKFMREMHSDINHYFDVWHMAKGT